MNKKDYQNNMALLKKRVERLEKLYSLVNNYGVRNIIYNRMLKLENMYIILYKEFTNRYGKQEI